MYNGVMSRLNQLPNYPAKESERKQRNIYGFYVRPTIYWSLQCELEGSNTITREEALQVFSNAGISMAIPITLVVFGSLYGFIELVSILLNVLKKDREVYDMLKSA